MKTAKFDGYKRYTDMTIQDIPESARLVVLAGPNGSGKSSIFDGFRTWHMAHGGTIAAWDEDYGHKQGSPSRSWPEHVQVEFHGELPIGPEEQKKLFYFRTAFRNEADFMSLGFSMLPSPLDQPRINRLIDNDVAVSDNYQRLVMQTFFGVYDDDIPDDTTKATIRDRLIGKVRNATLKIYPDLRLTGVGGIVSQSAPSAGTFTFQKGASQDFHYKNLSAGEKAVFDLVLDTVIKSEFYDASVWCIDEPETHLNTRVQAVLLRTLLDLLPGSCQLWIASHSIGFMRKAWEMEKETPGSVCFIDLQDKDFDDNVVLTPIQPTREFWSRTLDVALGDLAGLVAPEQIVLCEGRPANDDADQKAAFDAYCYRIIFAEEHPNTDFLSVGNSHAAASKDRLEIGYAIQTIVGGTEVIRLVDRDLRSPTEVEEARGDGLHVLSRRHIEAFLLDDEVLEALCVQEGQPEKVAEVIAHREAALVSSVARGHDADDFKRAGGETYNGVRQSLLLTQAGSGWEAFARDYLAPLIKPGMSVYEQLKKDVFGE